MKYVFYALCMLLMFSVRLSAVTADELMHIHKVTTTQMNAISNPQPGSLVYNTTENTIYFYTGSAWRKMRATGDETIINAGSGTNITGNGTSITPYILGVN